MADYAGWIELQSIEHGSRVSQSGLPIEKMLLLRIVSAFESTTLEEHDQFAAQYRKSTIGESWLEPPALLVPRDLTASDNRVWLVNVLCNPPVKLNCRRVALKSFPWSPEHD
jgi:hypothetical protein